jgi:hypothetical protein
MTRVWKRNSFFALFSSIYLSCDDGKPREFSWSHSRKQEILGERKCNRLTEFLLMLDETSITTTKGSVWRKVKECSSACLTSGCRWCFLGILEESRVTRFASSKKLFGFSDVSGVVLYLFIVIFWSPEELGTQDMRSERSRERSRRKLVFVSHHKEVFSLESLRKTQSYVWFLCKTSSQKIQLSLSLSCLC